MKSKGVTFKYSTEEKAAEYLTDKNNYLRTAAYRKNYQKYNNGSNIGKYIDLDFSYLQELSTIDMHFRFLVSKMCLDIEHDLKVRMLKDIETDPTTDGYDIVNVFLSHNNYIIGKLEATSASPFTSDLIHKYFTIQRVYNSQKGKKENKITSYDDCPAWVSRHDRGRAYDPALALFMVWLSLDDPVAAVYLLQQNDPHQLMGKGHFGKAQLIIGPGKHLL